MGEEVAQQEFTREDRTRYREKVRRCLDVFARMLRESRFDADAPDDRAGDRAQPRRRAGDPALKNAEALEAIADPDFQTELGAVQPRDQRAAQAAQGPRLHRVRGRRAREPQRRGGQGRQGGRAHGDDRHPADALGRPHEPGLADPQPALPAAQRPDPRGPRRGHRHRHRRSRAAAHHHGLDRARGGLHQHPAAHPGEPGGLPGLLERLAGHRRGAAGAGRQLAVPARPRAVAGDPGAAVRAGHRHPQRGAQGPGRAPPGLVRRALDHLDLRPVRGERALLPGAAAGHRRRGPAGGAGVRADALPLRAAAAQRHHLPLEPSGLRRRRRHPAPARGEPGAARRPDGRRHDGQRRLLLRPDPHPGRARAAAVVADVVQRGGGELPRRGPAGHRGHRSTGRGWARCRPPSSWCGGCCRWRGLGWTPGGCSREESDRLLGIIEQRCIVGQNGASWFATVSTTG